MYVITPILHISTAGVYLLPVSISGAASREYQGQGQCSEINCDVTFQQSSYILLDHSITSTTVNLNVKMLLSLRTVGHQQ